MANQQVKTVVDIALAFLDWPFLLFILIIVLALIFRDKITNLLERGDIQISWGENKHIKLKELSDGIDQELDPLKEEIEELKSQLNHLLSTHHNEPDSSDIKDEHTHEENNDRIKAGEQRIIDGLKYHQNRWRSIQKLASISGLNESETLDILRSNPDIVLSTAKSKRQIARLKTR